MQVLSHHLSPKVTKMYEAAQTDNTLMFRVLPSVDKDINKRLNKAFRTKVEKSAEKYLIRYMSLFLACLLLHVVPAVSPTLHARHNKDSAEIKDTLGMSIVIVACQRCLLELKLHMLCCELASFLIMPASLL